MTTHSLIPLALALLLTSSSLVNAQEAPPPVDEVGPPDGAAEEVGQLDPAAEPAPAEEASVAEPVAEAQSTPEAESEDSEAADGARFRFGVAGGAGPLIIEGSSLFYTGVDLRFGAQLNDLIGIYLQPQLGGYGGEFATSGGLIGFTGLVDFTFAERFFAGVGAGWAVLNSPSGPAIHLRAGGYPVLGRRSDKPRRKALMLGVDFRIHIVSNGLATATAVAPTFNIGYESF